MGLIGRIRGLRRLRRATSYIKHEHGVGYSRQWHEYRFFRRALAMNRAEFIGYGLWNVARPLADRLTTLSNHDRRLIEYRMNPRTANLQVRDKPWATARLLDAGIPVAEVLGLVTIGGGEASTATDRFPIVRGRAALVALLGDAPTSGLVVKPYDGESGRSVQVFAHAARSGLQHLDGSHWSIDRLVMLLETEPLWKVERRLETHSVLREIAGPTLGTLRLTTFTTRDGTIHLTPTGWKIPIGNSGVDHFSHGAGQLCAPVERETGRVGPARYWLRMGVMDRHPLTGVAIAGAVMPHWKAAQELARRSAACFPDLASTAFDIAMTDGGPVVIEVNPAWGERLIQAAWQRGLVEGDFLRFLEELGAEDVIRREARGIAGGPS